MASSPSVLLTGVNGFLATHVLIKLLESPLNYNVIGTLRSDSNINPIRQYLTSSGFDNIDSRLSFRIVADLSDKGQLKEACKEAHYIIHTASPYKMNVKDKEKDLFLPAIKGTKAVLEAASETPTIERIVITSSFSALADFSKGGAARPDYVYTEEDWNPIEHESAMSPTFPTVLEYAASKKFAEEAVKEFVEEQKPNFDVITICPPMMYGPIYQPGANKQKLNQSSSEIFQLISHANKMPSDGLPLFVSVRDSASVHTLALSSTKFTKPFTRLLVYGGSFTWGQACEYISRKYPQLLSSLPKGWQNSNLDTSKYSKMDITKTKYYLDYDKFESWEKVLDDTLQSLLALN